MYHIGNSNLITDIPVKLSVIGSRVIIGIGDLHKLFSFPDSFVNPFFPNNSFEFPCSLGNSLIDAKEILVIENVISDLDHSVFHSTHVVSIDIIFNSHGNFELSVNEHLGKSQQTDSSS